MPLSRPVGLVCALVFGSVPSRAQTALGPPVLWPSGAGGNGSSYQVFAAPAGISWSQACAYAVDLGGGAHLATVTSAAENAFVYSLIAAAPVWFSVPGTGTYGPWIGGWIPPGGGGYGWVTNEPFGYTNWAVGEPNNVCPGQIEDRIHFGNGGPTPSPAWNDFPDASCLILGLVRGFVVEFTPTLAPTPFGPPARWTVGAGGNGSYYQLWLAPSGISWSAARRFVETLGGTRHLATITSAAENAFVYALIATAPVWFSVPGPATYGPWIGGTIIPGGAWGWVTNEPFVFPNWSPGEPNNACLGFNEQRIHFGNPGAGPAPTWNDFPDPACVYLGLVRGFVVEWPDYIYDNGPVVSGMFNGAGFANTSVLQTQVPNVGGILGYSAVMSLGSWVADDFHLNAPGPITITEVEVFAYQTGSTTTSTITGLFVEITAGDPSLGAPPVPGSPGPAINLFTAGAVINNSWSQMYRVTDTTLGSSTRPVMAVRCALSAPIVLTPGLGYWIRYALTGSALLPGPWVPPVTIPNELNTGNAKQLLPAGWTTLANCPPSTPGCGNGVTIPFRLYGAGQTRYSIAAGVPGCAAATLTVGAAGDLGGVIRVDMNNTTPGAIPVLGFDFGAAVMSLCWNGASFCTIGHGWILPIFFSTGTSIPVPVSPLLFGLPLACQGAELGGAGACMGVAITNSVVVTLQF